MLKIRNQLNRLVLDTVRYRLESLLRKKSFLLVLAALFLLNMAYCVEIDSITAKTVAKNFYLSRLSQSSLKHSKGINKEVEFVLIHQENVGSSKTNIWNYKSQPNPLYYVFNVKDNNGFVIVSGDDRVTPVLGYAFTGNYTILNQAPAFKVWMRNYTEQIKFLIEKNPETNDNIQMEWSRLISALDSNSTLKINDLPPLLSTTWAQGCYYNEYCPVDSAGPCNRIQDLQNIHLSYCSRQDDSSIS